MASKRHKRRRTCQNKRAYRTESAAEVAARNYGERCQDSFVGVYACPFGSHFYIGHHRDRPKDYMAAERRIA